MPLFVGNNENSITYSNLEAPTSLIILQQSNSTISVLPNTPTFLLTIPNSVSVFSNIYIYGEFSTTPNITYTMSLNDIISLEVDPTDNSFYFYPNTNYSFRGYSLSVLPTNEFFLSVTASLLSLGGIPLNLTSSEELTLYNVTFSGAYVNTPTMQKALKPGETLPTIKKTPPC